MTFNSTTHRFDPRLLSLWTLVYASIKWEQSHHLEGLL